MRKKYGKQLACIVFAVCLVSAAVNNTCTADAEENYSETDRADIFVFPDKRLCEVSPYIYGINDTGDISGVKAFVLKQTGADISSYNWENNASDRLIDGKCVNGIHFAEPESGEDFSVPALYTEKLVKRAEELNIPVRLVTLQMMGFAAGDDNGVIEESEAGYSDRWAAVKYKEDFSYTNFPDLDDGIVYIDEYAAYLANMYGTAAEGGINGYFLDTEPDKWAENYPLLDRESTYPDSAVFIERSAELSSHIKTIDDSALVFGPSLSGVPACADFNGSFGSKSESFADYYLYEMKKAGEKESRRLLDVFDIHYFAEKNQKVKGTFPSEDAYVMESPRALYDESYNSTVFGENTAFFPLIPSLMRSINRSYPDTKLSFSEYNFGGGDRMSGCIAEIDALGAFAENGVYLACLYPDEINSYQKAGLNLYTNYDYNGSGVGDTVLEVKNSDKRALAYAFSNSDSFDTVWLILANKNPNLEKTFNISINSLRDFSVSKMYTISGNSSEIVANTDILPDITERKTEVVLPEKSVCLLVLKTGDRLSSEEHGEETSVTENNDKQPEGAVESVSEVRPEESTIEMNTVTETLPVSEESGAVTSPVGTEQYFETRNSSHDPEGIADTETEGSSENKDNEREFPLPLKIVAMLAATGCFVGIIYVFFVDK